MFGLEFGRLLIAKLGVDKSVKRLRRAHSVQLIHRRRVNGVWLAAVVANGVADQQPAILLVKIADPHFDQLGSTLFRRQPPNRLSRQQQFSDRGRSWWSRIRRLEGFHMNRRLIDGKIHVPHRAGWFQLVVQPLIPSPDEQICRGTCLGGLDKNLVLPPLDLK